MKIAIVGVGMAGSRIADALLEYSERTRSDFVSGVVAVNTARSDLTALQHVPVDRRILVGQAHVKGNGTGSNNELGVTIAREDKGDVVSAVDDVPIEGTDAFLVVAGLAGGTGGGGAPVFARALGRIYDEPVYGLGVLPSRDESGLAQLNAVQSLKTFLPEVTNLLVLDNNAWWKPGGGSVHESYGYINEEVARRLGILLTASEAPEGVTPEVIVDASEIMNTLAGGGITSIGYASTDVYQRRPGLPGVFDRLLGRRNRTFEADSVTVIGATVRRATFGRLTLPCDVRGTQKGLLVVAGPPELLSRKGIERAIDWLEDQTGTLEFRGGDFPLPTEGKLAAVVVFSGVTDVPRLQELQERAIETKRRLSAGELEAPDAFEDVTIPTEEELELPFGPEE